MRLTLSLNFSALLLLLLFLLLLLLDLSPFSESGGGGGEVDYGDALKKSIMFFEGQRSGFLPADQRINWRGNSGLGDGSELNVDLVGGYYDAGDNIKFGFPMAFTATMLAWSVVEFGSIMPAAELRQALVAIRWATDYLLKTVADPNRIYVQVGEPGSDHNCWERPEDMDTLRTVYFVEAPQPASDIAGETAAALAASSMAFRSFDPSYSYKLLGKAVEVFEYADKYRGAYSDNANVKSGACPFYCDFSGYQDELLWGAAWLKRATQNDSYFTYIKVNGKTLGAEDTSNEFGWDNKRAGTNVVIAKEVLDGTASAEALQSYKLMADGFICSLIPESPSSHIEYTPGGLIYKTGGSNLQHVTSISFLLLVYADYLSKSPSPVDCGGGVTITPAGLRGRAKRQADYVLGKNPNGMSYMVGFGYRYPQRPHHRGSSLPSIHDHPARIGCAEGALYFNQTDPNPNQLTGALVGGPGEGDEFADERRDYKKLEPTTYMNAPFVGVLAVLAAYPNIAY